MFSQHPDAGINVLELGCETGPFVNLLAHAYPRSCIYGVDISQDHINNAKKSAHERNIKNAIYICCDAAKLDDSWTAKFQYVFISDSLHDFAYADKVLQEIHRVLVSDGLVSIIDTPAHTKVTENFARYDELVVRSIASLMYCLPNSLNFEGSLGLGANWGMEAAVKLLEDCGFESTIKSTPGRSGLHYLCKKV